MPVPAPARMYHQLSRQISKRQPPSSRRSRRSRFSAGVVVAALDKSGSGAGDHALVVHMQVSELRVAVFIGQLNRPGGLERRTAHFCHFQSPERGSSLECGCTTAARTWIRGRHGSRHFPTRHLIPRIIDASVSLKSAIEADAGEPSANPRNRRCGCTVLKAWRTNARSSNGCAGTSALRRSRLDARRPSRAATSASSMQEPVTVQVSCGSLLCSDCGRSAMSVRDPPTLRD